LGLDDVLERITKEGGLSREEALRRIKEKVRELGGLIDDEAAALMIAKELGLNLPSRNIELGKLKIGDLVEGLRKVEIIGRVLRVSPPLIYKFRGDRSERAELILGDESGTIRVVLWPPLSNVVRSLKLGVGDAVKISGGVVRKFREKLEVNLSKGSSLEILKNCVELPKLNEIIGPISFIKLKVTDVYGPVVYEGRRKVACIEGKEEGSYARVVLWGNASNWAKLVKEGDEVLVGGVKLRREEGVREYILDRFSSIKLIERGVGKREVFTPSSLMEDRASYRIKGRLAYLGPGGVRDLLAYLIDEWRAVKVFIGNERIKRPLLLKSYLKEVLTLEGLEELNEGTFRTLPWAFLRVNRESGLRASRADREVILGDAYLEVGVYCSGCLRRINATVHKCVNDEGAKLKALVDLRWRMKDGDLILMRPWDFIEEVCNIEENDFLRAFKQGEDLSLVIKYEIEKLKGRKTLMKGYVINLNRKLRNFFVEEVEFIG